MNLRSASCGAGLLAGSVDLRVDVSARTAPLLPVQGEDRRGRRSCPPEARATPDLALL